MTYKISIPKTVEKALKKIPLDIRKKIIDKVNGLAQEPFPPDSKKLVGQKNPPLQRIRVGDYRVIYNVNKNILTIYIISIGHRKEIYR